VSDVLASAVCALQWGTNSFEDLEIFDDAKPGRFETFLELPRGVTTVTEPEAETSHETFIGFKCWKA
jgi:hypothetical protein